MAGNDRPTDGVGHDDEEDRVPVGGEAEAQTELDLTEIELNNPTDHAELKIRLWLIGTVHLKSPSATFIAIIGVAAAAGLMFYAIKEKADLFPVCLLALGLLVVTWFLVRRVPTRPLRSRLRRQSRHDT